MLKHSLKIAFRTIKRSPVESFINITGLALGIAVALISSLWIIQQKSFNHHFSRYEQIYQLMVTGTFNGEKSTDMSVSVPLSKIIESDFKNEIDRVAFTTTAQQLNFNYQQTKITASGIYASVDFARIFSLKATEGSLQKPLSPDHILISASFAKSLFGDQPATGKTVQLTDNKPYIVEAVYQDIPENNTFEKIQFILPFADYVRANPEVDEHWNNCFFNMYLTIPNKAVVPNVEKQLTAIFNKKLSDIDPQIILHPMSKWHLYETFKNGVNTGGSIQYVWMFALIAILILTLACINFINLTTARNLHKRKETGVLKTIGVTKLQLIWNGLSEAILLSVIASVIAIMIVQISLPAIQQLTSATLKIPYHEPLFYCIMITGSIVLGMLSGIYPAVFLANTSITKALKGKFLTSRKNLNPRKIMVTFQFTISIFMMIATLLMIRQLQYAKNRPVGYESDQLINVENVSPQIIQRFEVFRNELLQQGLIRNASCASDYVNSLSLSGGGFIWEGNDPVNGSIMGISTVDAHFGKTVGWKFKEGRDFSKDFQTDQEAVVMNEAAATLMNLTHLKQKQLSKRGKTYQIIGVIQNTISGSPFHPATPTVYFLDFLPKNKITIKLKGDANVKENLLAIQKIYNSLDPNSTFAYTFTDQSYAKQFRQMEMIKQLTGIFTAIAILISSMGVYALVRFVTQQRMKEIGIRKILGASTWQLWRMLSNEYVLLTLTGFIVAAPLAYLTMEKWLQNYPYRIAIHWTIFAAIALVSIAITLFTISFQSIKAFSANPVDSLRDE